ncbi:MAG: hypothetical protein ABI476_10670 [Oxalobacteraceae bacterium]
MSLPRIVPADIRIAIAIVLYILLLALLPLLLSAPMFRFTFSEEGPFERLSIVAWIFTALVIVVRIRPLGSRAWAFALLCIVFAAREADWHKAFTAASILKINYYKHTVAPLGEKLAAATVALAAIALLAYVGFVVARFLLRQGGWRSRSGIWLLTGTVLVVLGKMLDRAPAVLAEDYGIVLSPLVDLYADAFEEGLEMIHPLILAWSVWISQIERRYLS